MSRYLMQIGILLVCAGLVLVVVSFADEIDGTAYVTANK